MKQKKIITPLSKWPTEAILYLFRKYRQCKTKLPYDYVYRFNKKLNKPEYWLPQYGKYEDENGSIIRDIVSYKKYSQKEINTQFTHTYGCNGRVSYWDDWYLPTDNIWFRFEGMYWEGTIDDIRKELSKRPHCNIKGSKEFRKWKINWKRQNL
jgi:hypothetical protein